MCHFHSKTSCYEDTSTHHVLSDGITKLTYMYRYYPAYHMSGFYVVRVFLLLLVSFYELNYRSGRKTVGWLDPSNCGQLKKKKRIKLPLRKAVLYRTFLRIVKRLAVPHIIPVTGFGNNSSAGRQYI